MALLGLTPAQAQHPGSGRVNPAVQPGYFLFPIMPGDANSLSGGLGDLRPNHFHAGIDIRTQQREGLEVYAAADGHISRIAVFSGGYGNVVFIKHPNGMTTVYGHLRNLNDPLATYLRQEQYKQKTFEIDLRPEPGQFPVKKGEVIALSGNTGGSGGPHLHFEIRDEKDNLLNPLHFGFDEIEDTTPPYFERLVLRTLTPDARVNGQVGRVALTPVRRGSEYALSQPVSASGLVGIDLLAFDKTNGTPYKNGLSCIEIQMDGREVYAYNMDNFPHEQSRHINVHMDFATEQTSGQRFHRGYVADGNELPIYRTSAQRGRLPLFDGQPHEVLITLFDSFQNSARLRFTIQPEPDSTVIAKLTPSRLPTALTTWADENTLLIRAKNFPTAVAPSATLFASGSTVELPVSYVRANEAVYVVNLNRHLPDSVRVGNAMLPLNYRKRIAPGRETQYRDERLTIDFAAKSLFDTLHLSTTYNGNLLTISHIGVPLNEFIGVNFLPTEPVEQRERTQAYLVSGGRKKYLGGYWKGDRIHFRTRELGSFQLLTDMNPPTAQWVRKDANALVAKIRDDLSGIDTFRMLVNGEWVLMQYDYKRALIWSDRLDRTKPFEGEVTLEVKDRAGNVTMLTSTLPKAVPTPAADSLTTEEPETENKP